MNKNRIDRAILNYYLPVAFIAGGAGVLIANFPLLLILILTPSIFIFRKNILNLIFFIYIAITACYSVYSRAMFHLSLDFHDAAAIMLSMSVFSYCCMHIDYIKSRPHLAYFFVYFLIFSSLVGLYIGNYYFGSGLLNFRLVGLTTNPNQMALYALCALIAVKKSCIRPLVSNVMQILCILVGAFSGSDAFFVAISVIFILRLFLEVGMITRAFVFAFFVAVIPIVFINIGHVNIELDSQSLERFNRWIYALRIFFDYPHVIFFGFGPGAYGPAFDSTFSDFVGFSSGVEIVGTEFHNTFLDFFVSFGLLGLVFFGIFIKSNLRNIAITPEFVGLLAFSSFHLVYRHPIFWLALIFALHGSFSRKCFLRC
jgi:hypothetical protein